MRTRIVSGNAVNVSALVRSRVSALVRSDVSATVRSAVSTLASSRRTGYDEAAGRLAVDLVEGRRRGGLRAIS